MFSFLSILSGSLLDQLGESFTHPKDIPSRLASAVSAQSDFFITYILTNGMSGFSLEVLQFGLLTWQFLKVHSLGHSKEPYLYGFPYYRVVPIVSLAILIGVVYAVVAPLLLPILLIYFLLGYAVYINQMEDVYEITYDTCGQYWPKIHHYIFLSVTLMQITMIGLFGRSQSLELPSPQFPCLCSTFFSMNTARSDFSQLSTIDRSRLPSRVMSLMRLKEQQTIWTMHLALISHRGCVQRTWNLVLYSL